MTLAPTQSTLIYLVTPIIKFKIFKMSFWKCIIVLSFAKTQHLKKNDLSSNRSTLHILKFSLHSSSAELNQYKSSFPLIYINCWSLERKRNMLKKSWRQWFSWMSLSTFSARMNLMVFRQSYLGFICTKCPHYYETRLSTY